jgi:toxin ParE1/3/4
MEIIWYERARYDVHMLQRYIARDKPEAAKRVAHSVFTRVTTLSLFPEMGRIGTVTDTRELIFADISIVVPYRIVEGAVHILRVYSTSQQWSDML